MVNPDPVASSGSTLRKLAWSIGLVVLLGLAIPVTIQAAPPVTEGAEKCVECHEQESDAWHDSPHSQADSTRSGSMGATCEDCHGPYVEDHPEAGVMQLSVDSTICHDCHTSTFEQWEDSTHAQAGVQCIGCHLSHSQAFRLTDDSLCSSCHQDRAADYGETCHGFADVACTDCHLSSMPGSDKVRGSVAEFKRQVPSETAWISTTQHRDSNLAIMALMEFDRAGDPGPAAPNHDFTEVSSEDCLACHQQKIHEESLCTHGNSTAHENILIKAEGMPELAAKLETAKNENKSLQIMAPVCLGLGIGLGLMLGIILMLAIGYISQARAGT